MDNPLIGKTLLSIQLAKDRQVIKFNLSDGEVVALCDADCCSYTWIEEISHPTLGYPALVRSVEDLNLPQEPVKSSTFHKNADSLAFYGFKIVTDKGEITIDYRNDSNGYYGGSLTWPAAHHYGGVYGQNVSEQEWEPAP